MVTVTLVYYNLPDYIEIILSNYRRLPHDYIHQYNCYRQVDITVIPSSIYNFVHRLIHYGI